MLLEQLLLGTNVVWAAVEFCCSQLSRHIHSRQKKNFFISFSDLTLQKPVELVRHETYAFSLHFFKFSDLSFYLAVSFFLPFGR